MTAIQLLCCLFHASSQHAWVRLPIPIACDTTRIRHAMFSIPHWSVEALPVYASSPAAPPPSHTHESVPIDQVASVTLD